MKKILIYGMTAMLICSSLCTYTTFAQEDTDDLIYEENQDVTDEYNENIDEDSTEEDDIDVSSEEDEMIDVEDWWTQKTAYFDFSNDAFYGSGNPMPAPYCTWYVWGRVKQMTGIELSPKVNLWVNSSYGGVGMVDTPSTYSIMMAYQNGAFVHAAFVESWDGVNIKISETNNAMSNDTHRYYEYSGTFEDYITRGKLYNGWTSIKFIPLVRESLNGKWVSVGNDWYYYLNEQYVTGWQYINNKWYYFENDGKMVTGLTEINGKLYLLSDDMKTGFYEWENAMYYFCPDKGNMEGMAVNGWKKINNRWFYFNDYKMVNGFCEVDGVPYYFDGGLEGALFTGWKQIHDIWYYFTTNGAVNGWNKISNKWYYFDGYKMKDGYHEVDGVPYYFNDSGSLFTGWKQIDDIWYYFTTNGAVNGWKKISNKWYYFDDYKMKTGWIDDSGKQYYLDASGKMLSGWQLIQGNWYYLNSSKVVGWIKLNNKWYYLDECTDNKDALETDKGIMVTGWKEINNKLYYFYSNGAMA